MNMLLPRNKRRENTFNVVKMELTEYDMDPNDRLERRKRISKESKVDNR